MKTFHFIEQAIGEMVYVTGERDLAMHGELRKIIFNKTPLRLIKLTKSGNAYLQDEDTKEYYSVPPSNVREIGN